MKKRVLCMILAASMALALAACGSGGTTLDDLPGDPPGAADGGDSRPSKPYKGEAQVGAVPGGQSTYTEPEPAPAEEPEEPEPEKTVPPVPELAGGTDVAPLWFEDDLQAFLEGDAYFNGRNYMASPASFKAALCLAIEGASGETRNGLLEAARFSSYEDMQGWHKSLLDGQAAFAAEYGRLKAESEEWGDGSDPGMGFDIANAVWDNASRAGGFRPDYVDAVLKKYGATAASSPASEITADVNRWCSEKTHGMIDAVSDDLSESASVLVNALYVKSGWTEAFSGSCTETGPFTRADGSTADADFMNQTGRFLYYKDPAGRRYALFGLRGDIWLTVCLDGDARVQDLYGASYKAEYELLDVRMPKLDMETELSHGEFMTFLERQGAAAALADGADFSAMTDHPEGWHIGDVVQKTRIKTDEEGMEAAAVTAIMMKDNAAVMVPEDPVEFHMDRPFRFMITSGRYTVDGGAVILFFGQYTGVG